MAVIRYDPVHTVLHLLSIAVKGETLDRLHGVIESEISASSKRLEEAGESDSPEFAEMVCDEECQAIEELLGLAFVAAQSFITSIRTEISSLAVVFHKQFGSHLSFVSDPKAYNVLTMGPKLDPAHSFCVIEAINAVANYSKHSEEWPTKLVPSGKWLRPYWDVSALRANEKTTVEIVRSLGLAPASTGNLRRATQALGITELDDLLPLRRHLKDWAFDLKMRAYSDIRGTP